MSIISPTNTVAEDLLACYVRISKKSGLVGREEMTWREEKTQLEETVMNGPIALENQLLVTKFYMPVTSGSLISRPRLIDLLNESWKYPLTLVSAAAGFGKTTLL